ncbi:MAG: dolichyl-phosphate beta-glucosyltransferase [Chloroflexota bacterium]
MASTSNGRSSTATSAPAEPSVHAAPTFQRLTLVLPAYNEATRIGPALDELFGWLATPARAALPPGIRVLVVDDGSTDRTAHLVLDRPEAAVPEDAPLRLELLRVPHGGKGAAVRAGMLAATGDVIVFADADMATPPHQLPKLLAALAGGGAAENPGADVALGSRIQPDGSDMRASQPAYRRLLGRAFHALASIWVVGPVQDTQCGFKGFRRAAAREIFGHQRITSIVFDVELIHLARRLGCSLAIVPIEWADVRGSRMRPRLGLALRVAWDLFRIPLLHRGVRAERGFAGGRG